MNAAEYINVDRDINTGKTLSILDLVFETRSADHVSDDDEDDEQEEPSVKKNDARKGLPQAITFFEQNPALSAHLDDLWKAMCAIRNVQWLFQAKDDGQLD